MALDKAAKKISDSYMGLLIAVVLILLAVISLELINKTFSKLDPSQLYAGAKALGLAGAILAFTAVVFFPLRKLGIHLKDRSKFTAAPAYKQAMKITAFLHPVIALLGFFLLAVHGFIFLKVIFAFEFSTLITMGALALTFITLLFLTGTFLKKKLSRKRLRIFHFFTAIIFAGLFILHLLAG